MIETACELKNLPIEIHRIFFSFLFCEDLAQVTRVCTLWRVHTEQLLKNMEAASKQVLVLVQNNPRHKWNFPSAIAAFYWNLPSTIAAFHLVSGLQICSRNSQDTLFRSLLGKFRWLMESECCGVHNITSMMQAITIIQVLWNIKNNHSFPWPIVESIVSINRAMSDLQDLESFFYNFLLIIKGIVRNRCGDIRGVIKLHNHAEYCFVDDDTSLWKGFPLAERLMHDINTMVQKITDEYNQLTVQSKAGLEELLKEKGELKFPCDSPLFLIVQTMELIIKDHSTDRIMKEFLTQNPFFLQKISRCFE